MAEGAMSGGSGKREAGSASVTKRCAVCGRFRPYEEDDAYCLLCGHEALEAHCACGRAYDYALTEEGDLHCPRCGRTLRGRSTELE
jgi:hypothetical protein